MMEHLTPPPPYRRENDPPDGSRAARWADALRPWQSLLTAVLLVWSVVSAVMLSAGYAMSTPSDAVEANSARIAAIETMTRADRTRLDRLEALTMALVQSKCLELDAGSQAISVLPCRSLGIRPRDGQSPSSTRRHDLGDSVRASYQAPDWDTLLPPGLRRNLATNLGGYRQ